MPSNSNKLLTLDGRLNLKARGDNHPLARAVITPTGRYGSCALAAEAHGLSKAGAKNRADHRIGGWRWEKENTQSTKRETRAR